MVNYVATLDYNDEGPNALQEEEHHDANSILPTTSGIPAREDFVDTVEIQNDSMDQVHHVEEPWRRGHAGLLTEQMDGVESGGNRRRRMLKERFGFMGCCRAAWANAFRSHHREQPQRQMDPDPDPGAGMNLAATLAVERRLRGPAEEEGEAPWRVSLMRLLEEDDLDPFFSHCGLCGMKTTNPRGRKMRYARRRRRNAHIDMKPHQINDILRDEAEDLERTLKKILEEAKKHSCCLHSSIQVRGSEKPHSRGGYACRVEGLSPNPIGSFLFMKLVE
ncbi:hypothetical protein Fmac_019163 [Flemingia macrophylla]|uniref:Uncharacterized protein n=1 Tax=Flemingia macrophylla TaxID=520843 RepID=A0ABD1M737_9FABA